MRRDKLSVELVNAHSPERSEPKLPRFVVRFDGPETELASRFHNPADSVYTPEQLDVSFREQAPSNGSPSTGVFSVSDRLTGDYLFEVTASTGLIGAFSDAVRRYTEATEAAPRYEVALWAAETERAVFTKHTFLVFQQDGTLLRHHCVIPASVEL